jgi:hypothetical protein
LVDTELDVGIMDRSADVHEITLPLEFPAFGLPGSGRKVSQDLVGFFGLSCQAGSKRKEKREGMFGRFSTWCKNFILESGTETTRTHGNPVQPEYVPLEIDLSDLMDLPPGLVVLAIDVLVLGFTDGQTDIVALTDVPPGYPIVRLDKLFPVQDAR